MSNVHIQTLILPALPAVFAIRIASFGDLAGVIRTIHTDEAIAVFRIIALIVETLRRVAIGFASCPQGLQAGVNNCFHDTMRTWNMYRTNPTWTARAPIWARINAGRVFRLLCLDINSIARMVGCSGAIHFDNFVSPAVQWVVKKLTQADSTGTMHRRFGEYVIQQPRYRAPEVLPDSKRGYYRQSIAAYNHDETLLGLKKMIQNFATEVSPDRLGICYALFLYTQLGRLAGKVREEQSDTQRPISPSKLISTISNMAVSLNLQVHDWKQTSARHYREVIAKQDLATDLLMLVNHVFHDFVAIPGLRPDEGDYQRRYMRYVLAVALEEQCDLYGYVREELNDLKLELFCEHGPPTDGTLSFK